jgi:hypothetical protein
MNVGYVLEVIIMSIPEIPPKERDELIEFLDHNEWGVAYELLSSVIEQEEIVIDQRTRLLMDEARKVMGLSR